MEIWDKAYFEYSADSASTWVDLWASDNYCHAVSVEFEKLRSAGLRKQEFKLVAGENVARILNLST